MLMKLPDQPKVRRSLLVHHNSPITHRLSAAGFIQSGIQLKVPCQDLIILTRQKALEVIRIGVLKVNIFYFYLHFSYSVKECSCALFSLIWRIKNDSSIITLVDWDVFFKIEQTGVNYTKEHPDLAALDIAISWIQWYPSEEELCMSW